MISTVVASNLIVGLQDFTEPFPASRGIITIVLAWFSAQAVKIVRGVIREHRFNFRWFLQTGGMPSSHSAAVACLSTVVGLYYGFVTIPFIMVLVFTLIIMFDAAGVRRQVGRQAGVLNKIMDDLYERGQIPEARIKELLGHTPYEVLAGAAIGILFALWLCT